MVDNIEKTVRLKYKISNALKSRADEIIEEYYKWKRLIQLIVSLKEDEYAQKKMIERAEKNMRRCKTELERLELLSQVQKPEARSYDA